MRIIASACLFLVEVGAEWQCIDGKKLATKGTSDGKPSSVDGCEANADNKNSNALNWGTGSHYCTLYTLEEDEFQASLEDDTGHVACFNSAGPSPRPSPPTPLPTPPKPTPMPMPMPPPAPGEWACQWGWKINAIGKKHSKGTVKSVESCQDACVDTDGCQAFNLNIAGHGDCNVFTGSFSYVDMDADLMEDTDHVVCYKGIKSQKRKEADKLVRAGDSGSWTHYPYNDKAIKGKAIDGTDSYPDYDLTFGNVAPSCPSEFRKQCKVTGGDGSKEENCHCNTGSSHVADEDCFKCELNGAVPRYPDFEEYNSNDSVPVTTRQEILERALGWVTNGHGYRGKGGPAPEGCYKGQKNCPAWGYTSVCQGIVQMAWQTVHASSHNGGFGIGIHCDDVKPGDHIWTNSHQQLFRRWSDKNTKGKGAKWIVWQMGGGDNKANAAEWGYSDKVNGCYVRRNIKGETEEAQLRVLSKFGLLKNNVLERGYESKLKAMQAVV